MQLEAFINAGKEEIWGLSPILQALWYDYQDDWDKSHDIAQEIHTDEGSWIHAYLHRKEGDHWNANYWYNKAGRSMPSYSLDEERERITLYFLKQL